MNNENHKAIQSAKMMEALLRIYLLVQERDANGIQKSVDVKQVQTICRDALQIGVPAVVLCGLPEAYRNALFAAPESKVLLIA